MLPGAGIEAADFAKHGMTDVALHVDVIAVQPELELYLDGSIALALHDKIIEPALARGYTWIWLLGISLGGMGALLYADAYPSQIEGLVLLAPFLGTKGTVAEMAKAGGLAAWSSANSAATEPEQRMLIWLQNHLAQKHAPPLLYLGYGNHDRFAQGHRMLADLLPAHRVFTTESGHDWDAWAPLWRQILNAEPFSAKLDDADSCEYHVRDITERGRRS